MPTYEYVCGACSEVVEFFQAITENPKRKCPSCGALKLKRRIGAGAGIIFKGSGFYTTDYRSDSYRADAKRDTDGGKSSSENTSDSTTKSEPQATSSDS